MSPPPPPPARFLECVQSSLQQHQHQIVVTAAVVLGWFLLSELLRLVIRAARNTPAPPPANDISDEDDEYEAASESASPGPPNRVVKAETYDSDYSTDGSVPVKAEPLGSPLGRRVSTPATPVRARLTSIPLPPPRFPNSPYIRNSSPPPTPLSPGSLVLRPRPTLPTDPSTHDGPFLVLSTSNPAPKHLSHLPGAALASWAELDLPAGSRAERWYKESALLRYTGALTKVRVREWTRPSEDGRYVMHMLRGERWKGGKREFRVAWRGWPVEDDTWESAGKVQDVDPGLVGDFEERKRGV